jgi:chemotaxis response regulator CheB
MDTIDSFVRILVADDNELVRRGLCSPLQQHPGWCVCGEATGGMDAVEKSMRLKPDVILVDVSMPDLLSIS